MGVPLYQKLRVTSYVLTNKLRRIKRYPLVLMLEPLFRCNLACPGCGKVQYPRHIRMNDLTVEQCLHAVDQCPAPIVYLAGGEPLLHKNIDTIVNQIIKRDKYVYMCTNAVLLEENLSRLQPSKHFCFSIHLDGPERIHDYGVSKNGVYQIAVDSLKSALNAGFRVSINTTLFDNADPDDICTFFDEMTALGIEGLTLSPGYAYEKAAHDDDRFLRKQKTHELFRKILGQRHNKPWVINQNPLYLEFLMGYRDFECQPWGNPTYNMFGWQFPCYLQVDGYADTFNELLNKTDWSNYGTKSGNPHCQDCMVYTGYELSAVQYTFSGISGMLATIRAGYH